MDETVRDWDGNGTDGVGTKAIAESRWPVRNSASDAPPDLTFDYGAVNDLPLTCRN